MNARSSSELALRRRQAPLFASAVMLA